jgi:hypothetical protein
MVGMTLLLVAAGLVVVAVVGGGLRHRLVDERHSVRDYQQTLETLRHLSEHRPPAAEQAGRGRRAAFTRSGGPPPS